MAEENNTCVICLESLVNADDPIGVTVPCGHCFHRECFQGWRKSKLGPHHRHSPESVKCPMCNIQTTSFCRIFLDLGAVDCDDDHSLSSEESVVEQEKESTEDRDDDDDDDDDDDEPEAAPKQGRGKPVQEQEVVDLSADEPPARVSQGSKSDGGSGGDRTESEQRYRKMAKKYKTKVKRIDSERERQSASLQKLASEHDGVQKQLKEVSRVRDGAKVKYEKLKRASESSSLDAVRYKRERDETRNELKTTKNKTSSLETKMYELKRQYTKDIERAHANSMTEVQTILNQHPKLTEQNRRYREELLRKDERIATLENQKRSGSVHRTAEAPRMDHRAERNSLQNVNRTAKAAKLMRELQEFQSGVEPPRPARTENDEVKRRMKGKVSANAARFSRASERPASRAPTAMDMLDTVDRQRAPGAPSKRPFPPDEAKQMQVLLQASRKQSKLAPSKRSFPPDEAKQMQVLLQAPRKRSKLAPSVRPAAILKARRPQSSIVGHLQRRK